MVKKRFSRARFYVDASDVNILQAKSVRRHRQGALVSVRKAKIDKYAMIYTNKLPYRHVALWQLNKI